MYNKHTRLDFHAVELGAESVIDRKHISWSYEYSNRVYKIHIKCIDSIQTRHRANQHSINI